MIIIEAPQENRLILDINNTIISIMSDNGANHYFRAKIYINDVFFDEQGWSREDDFLCNKDLKKLYYAYFQAIFSSSITTGIVEKTNLIKKVTIIINEHRLSDDVIVDTETLNDFYIHFGQKPQLFSDLETVQFLDIKPSIIQAPLNAKLVFPFFVVATANDIICSVLDDVENVLYTNTISAVTGKKVYEFKLNFASLTIPEEALFLTVKIQVGSTSITKIISLIRISSFAIKEIMFKNNFGYFLKTYIDGEWEIEDSLSPESYKTADASDKIIEINSEKTFKINTGNLLASEKAIISQIANSTEIHILFGNKWYEVVTATKKILEEKELKHQYEEDLIFKLNGNQDINSNDFAGTPEIEDFVVTGTENIELVIEKTAFLAIYESLVPAAKIRFLNLSTGILSTVKDDVLTPVVANQIIVLENIDSFSFMPVINTIGDPYASFAFQMSNDYNWSNTANMAVIIEEGEYVNTAPVIFLNNLYKIYLDEAGEGTKVITATVVDPDGDSFSVHWEILGTTTGVTLTNETTTAVTITTAAEATGTFQIKCTAVDSELNSNSKTINIQLIPTEILIGFRISSNTVTEAGTVFEFESFNGFEDETIDFKFDVGIIKPGQFAIINYGSLDEEVILDIYNTSHTQTGVFTVDGLVGVAVLVAENGITGQITLNASVENPSVGEIDPASETLQFKS